MKKKKTKSFSELSDDELLDYYSNNLHELADNIKIRDAFGIDHCNVIGKLLMKALTDRGIIYRQMTQRN